MRVQPPLLKASIGVSCERAMRKRHTKREAGAHRGRKKGGTLMHCFGLHRSLGDCGHPHNPLAYTA